MHVNIPSFRFPYRRVSVRFEPMIIPRIPQQCKIIKPLIKQNSRTLLLHSWVKWTSYLCTLLVLCSLHFGFWHFLCTPFEHLRFTSISIGHAPTKYGIEFRRKLRVLLRIIPDVGPCWLSWGLDSKNSGSPNTTTPARTHMYATPFFGNFTFLEDATLVTPILHVANGLSINSNNVVVYIASLVAVWRAKTISLVFPNVPSTYGSCLWFESFCEEFA